jgi:hypothetical protein
MFFLWSIFLLVLLPLFIVVNDSSSTCRYWNVPDAVWHTAAVTVAVYSSYFFVLFHVVSGVSLPCGPRPHKITRQPQWNNRLIPLPALVQGDKFKCVYAQESHNVTEEVFQGTGASLTGEAAGRDIWTGISKSKSSQSQGKKTKVDERLVQEMASGGREPGGFNPALNPNSCDIPLRAQMIRAYMAAGNTPPSTDVSSKPKTVQEALHKGVHFYSMLQSEDGHWSGDYGGPHFLMPGLIVAWYIMGRSEKMLGKDEVELMKHYLIVHQQTDGGWGTHIESPSTMFGTTLNYVALRLLGMDITTVCTGTQVYARQWRRDYDFVSQILPLLAGCMHWDGHKCSNDVVVAQLVSSFIPVECGVTPEWCIFQWVTYDLDHDKAETTYNSSLARNLL